MSDDDDVVGWEDADPQIDGNDIAWEDDDYGDADADSDAAGNGDGDGGDLEFEVEDVDEEPEERRWLGHDGEIVVELPGGEEDQDDGGGGGGGYGDGDGDGEGGGSCNTGKGKGKAKTRVRRFTAEETRQALDVHKAHLACLVARCAMVSRWAGDPNVLAAMVSCLPGSLLSKEPALIGQRDRRRSAPTTANKGKGEGREEGGGERREGEGAKDARGKLTLADLVVWFREFITVLDDGAVGGEGPWGSRPPRLMRVIEQRAGCAQEAAQIFVALCRGLGLRARYVACLDPVPPSPFLSLVAASAALPAPSKSRGSRSRSKQTWENTVDFEGSGPAAAEQEEEEVTEGGQGRRDRRRRRRQRRRGGSPVVQEAGYGSGSPQAWAEVLCLDDGKELYAVAGEERNCPSGHPLPPLPLSPRAMSPLRSCKRQRTAPSPPPAGFNCAGSSGTSRSEPPPLAGDEDKFQRPKQQQAQQGGGARTESDLAGPKVGAATATAMALGATARTPRAGSKRKAEAAAAAIPTVAVTGAAGGVTTETAKTTDLKQKGGRRNRASAGPASDVAGEEARKEGKVGGGGAAGTAAATATATTVAANGLGGSSGDGRKRGRKNGSGEGEGGGGRGGGVVDGAAAAFPPPARAVRNRWVHVDPVRGAVDQPEKVQDLRFRKRLMPYVVAVDEKQAIVDVTRRYSSEWARTLRTRGRMMASPHGWWNRSLRAWGTAVDRGPRRRQQEASGAGAVVSPLVVEEEDGKLGADAAVDNPSASEEKELQEKVNSEPIPSTIAALRNHHVYVLGKSLLKYEVLRPGAKVAGLVKGSKVYHKTDVVKLRGASGWKKDSLQVKRSELAKPAKMATKRGEKDGEGTSKLYGEWQTEPWVPEAAVDGKVPKNEYGNVEFFDCSPAFLPPGTEHVRGDQIGRVAAKLGVDYAPALTGFDTKQGRQVPVLDGIIVCKEQSQMLREAHMTWEQTLLEKQVKARSQKVLRRWRTLFQGVMLGAQLLEEYGDHD